MALLSPLQYSTALHWNLLFHHWVTQVENGSLSSLWLFCFLHAHHWGYSGRKCPPLVHLGRKWLFCLLLAHPWFIQSENGCYVSFMPAPSSFRYRMALLYPASLKMVHTGRKWLVFWSSCPWFIQICLPLGHYWLFWVENGYSVFFMTTTGSFR